MGNSLATRFSRKGNIQDLELAIEFQRSSIKLLPDGHSDLAGYLSDLGSNPEARFVVLQRFKDLQEAIKLQWEAIDLTPDDDATRVSYYLKLDNVLQCQSRADRVRSGEDLEAATVAKYHAVEMTPDRHSDRPAALAGYSDTLETVGLTPAGHPQRSQRLYGLGSALTV